MNNDPLWCFVQYMDIFFIYFIQFPRAFLRGGGSGFFWFLFFVLFLNGRSASLVSVTGSWPKVQLLVSFVTCIFVYICRHQGEPKLFKSWMQHLLLVYSPWMSGFIKFLCHEFYISLSHTLNSTYIISYLIPLLYIFLKL